MDDFITQYAENDNFFLFYTDFIYELSQDVANILSGYGIDMSGLLVDENDRKYSQIGGIFTLNGESDFISVSPSNDGKFHYGLNGFVGPVNLAGEKAGWDFGIEIDNSWQWNGKNTTTPTVENVQSMIDGSDEYAMPNPFRNVAYQKGTWETHYFIIF